MERALALFARQAYDGIALVDPAGRIQFVNDAAAAMFDRTNLVGVALADLLPRRYRELFAEPTAVLELARARGERALEVCALRQGEEFVLEIALGEVRDGDRLLYGAILRDVTARRRAETDRMLDDRLSALGRLAGGTAHEINNPLTAVIANLDFGADGIKGTGASQDLVDALADARSAAHRVRDVVRGLKPYSRSEHERPEPTDLARVVTATASIVIKDLRHRARFVKALEPAPQVMASEPRLAQALVHLLLRAAHSVPEGRMADNEVRVRTGTDASGWALLEVTDTGPSLPPDRIDRALDPFFAERDQRGGGCSDALGLAIVASVVRSLGGRIEVSSAPRHNSVRVLLPPIQARAEAAPSAVAARPDPTRAGRILVIDDEVSVGTAVRRTLGRLHSVEVVTSGREGLDRLLAGERYDLILCDLMMPEVTGMDVHQRLSDAGSPAIARMVFLTGGAFTPRARGFLDRVNRPCLEKPFDPDALRALVAGVVSGLPPRAA